MTRPDKLLTLPEVLDELGGVSRRTFYRWRELGRAPVCLQLPNDEPLPAKMDRGSKQAQNSASRVGKETSLRGSEQAGSADP